MHPISVPELTKNEVDESSINVFTGLGGMLDLPPRVHHHHRLRELRVLWVTSLICVPVVSGDVIGEGGVSGDVIII